MPAHITLIRHAETTANVEQRWQGASDTEFSERGRRQLARLRRRLASRRFDRVVASDLGRAAQTAEGIAHGTRHDTRLREPNVGAWEGRHLDDVRREYPNELDDLFRGRDVRLGGGERLSEVGVRMRQAFDDLVDDIGEEGSGLVVSHGMALLTLVANLLGTTMPVAMHMMGNAAVTEFSVDERGPQMLRYNDYTHLEAPPRLRDVVTHVYLVRHGETQANIEGRWQGHGDWPLTDRGSGQAQLLAATLATVDAVVASPLQRAHRTAEQIARNDGHHVVVDDRLKEIGFGSWENLTREEIKDLDPDGLRRIIAGEDITRGRTGETFASVQARMTEAIDAIATTHAGRVVGVVSHGGATRAYLTGLLDIPFVERNRVRTLDNTAYAHLTFGGRGPLLAAWNLSPHLDEAAPGERRT